MRYKMIYTGPGMRRLDGCPIFHGDVLATKRGTIASLLQMVLLQLDQHWLRSPGCRNIWDAFAAGEFRIEQTSDEEWTLPVSLEFLRIQ